jgi:hypothetical protein
VLPRLFQAVVDLSLLRSREYAPTASLKLVGDHYALTARQRVAVARCACSDQDLAKRRKSEVLPAEAEGQSLLLDGYNLLTTIEAALAGGVILHGRDSCYRDMASMHGTYRRVVETQPALQVIADVLVALAVRDCKWYLDSPVSNSGQLRALILRTALDHGWPWEVELVPDPDPMLAKATEIVVTSDSGILDSCKRWLNLAHFVVDTRVLTAWTLDLTG